MKTAKLTKMLESYLKTLIVLSVCTIYSLDSVAQKALMSFEIASDITGSGLGGNVCPSFALTYKKNTLSVGPNFQVQKMKLSGIQANYRYSAAVSYNGKRELFFLGNLTYHSSARMGSGYVDIEESSRPEMSCNYEEMRFKVVEGYAGIGLKINHNEKFSTGFTAGMGAFNTLDKNYDKEMFRQKASVVAQFRVFVAFNLNNNY